MKLVKLMNVFFFADESIEGTDGYLFYAAIGSLVLIAGIVKIATL